MPTAAPKINYTTTQGGIVLLRNVLPTSVPDNFNPYHQNCTAPGAQLPSPAAPPASPLALEGKLATLKGLHGKGYLSDEVYATRQAALLETSGL